MAWANLVSGLSELLEVEVRVSLILLRFNDDGLILIRKLARLCCIFVRLPLDTHTITPVRLPLAITCHNTICLPLDTHTTCARLRGILVRLPLQRERA